MTLTRRLTRALKRIKALEQENAILKFQVKEYRDYLQRQAQPHFESGGNSTVPFVVTGTPVTGSHPALYTQFNPAANATATTANTFLFWPDGEPVR